MQGAPRRQVNADDMLAELKRALESSTHTPDAPPPSASTAPKPRSPGRETGRSQIDNRSDRPAKATADKSIGPRAGLQKSTKPSSRSWKLIGGGLALAALGQRMGENAQPLLLAAAGAEERHRKSLTGRAGT